LAPEHEFSTKIAKDNKKVKTYIENALRKSELERKEEGTEKTGIFTGEYATNQLNGKRLPIWVSDFVLYDYGTGAVVGVPGHDIRDFDFAKKFDLEIIRVIKDKEGNEGDIKTRDDVFEGYGVAINSEFLNGMESDKAIEKMIKHLESTGIGEKSVTYGLRDQIWSRQRYWGDPIPLIHKKDGTVEPDYDLPVELPKLDDFLPENGEAPLEKLPDWFKVTASDGSPAKRETDTMPTWAGSNWYYIRYIDPNNEEAFADMEKMKYWMPVDKYFGDAGHTTAHLLYSRFWYRFLFDHKYVPNPEPYQWRMSGGLLLGADRRKMSKSRPEYVVDPKDLIESYGADATRIYLAFIGPYNESYPWNENGIKACYRFVKNVFELKNKVSEKESSANLKKVFHNMLKNVTSMLEDLKMNTAVSEMMIFLNETKNENHISKSLYLEFIKVLAPFAPFTSEELWQEISNFKEWKTENSVHLQPWPEFDEEMIKEDEITIPVQINGKLRGELVVAAGADEDSIKEQALKLENVTKYTKDKHIKKVIYIKNRILNIVV